MAIDWRDQRHTDKLTFLMVDPSNIDVTIGELTGVELSGSSVVASYYTDTRTSASLTLHDSNYVRGSFIRIIHEVPEWNYRNVLGTYIVTDESADRSNGEWVTKLDMKSRLWGLSSDYPANAWGIGAGTMVNNAVEDVFRSCGFKHKALSPNDRRISQAMVLESDKSQLQRLFALMKSGNNRLDVDPYGYITYGKYVKPADKTPSMTIDLADEYGIVQDSISRDTDWTSIPTRVTVLFKWTDDVNGKSVDRQIVGRANATGEHSIARRGFCMDDLHNESDLQPRNQWRANQLANQYLQNDQHEKVEWSLTTMYVPLWEGDVVNVVVHDGEERFRGTRKCLVKEVEIGLKKMSMKLTLKETASGDKGDEE